MKLDCLLAELKLIKRELTSSHALTVWETSPWAQLMRLAGADPMAMCTNCSLIQILPFLSLRLRRDSSCRWYISKPKTCKGGPAKLIFRPQRSKTKIQSVRRVKQMNKDHQRKETKQLQRERQIGTQSRYPTVYKSLVLVFCESQPQFL